MTTIQAETGTLSIAPHTSQTKKFYISKKCRSSFLNLHLLGSSRTWLHIPTLHLGHSQPPSTEHVDQDHLYISCNRNQQYLLTFLTWNAITLTTLFMNPFVTWYHTFDRIASDFFSENTARILPWYEFSTWASLTWHLMTFVLLSSLSFPCHSREIWNIHSITNK